jgi:hypothetical protein
LLITTNLSLIEIFSSPTTFIGATKRQHPIRESSRSRVRPNMDGAGANIRWFEVFVLRYSKKISGNLFKLTVPIKKVPAWPSILSKR